MIENLKTAGHNLVKGHELFYMATAFTVVASPAIIASKKHENSKFTYLWMLLGLCYTHIYFSFFEGLLNNKRIEEIQ